jgi:phosphoribosyl-ATP pyrophosphohydrolase
MKKDIDTEIVEWSMQAFPDLTMEKQLVKLSHEIDEVCQAKREGKDEDVIYELADVYIVSRILADRFDNAIGKHFIGLLTDHPTQKAIEAVKAKMKKNKARKWEKIADGTYHHKDEQ